VKGAGLAKGGVRRLAPVAVVDSLFEHRQFGVNIIPRPPGLPALPPLPAPVAPPTAPSTAPPPPYVMELDGMHKSPASRNIYWPAGAPGILHLRFIAVEGRTTGAAALQVGVGLESWVRDGNGTFQHSFPRCTVLIFRLAFVFQ
jgi:hypothetical protein